MKNKNHIYGPTLKDAVVVEADVIHFEGIGLEPSTMYFPTRDELYYVLLPRMALVVFGFLGLRREEARYITCSSGEVLFEASTYARAIAVVNPEHAEQVVRRSASLLERGRAMCTR